MCVCQDQERRSSLSEWDCSLLFYSYGYFERFIKGLLCEAKHAENIGIDSYTDTCNPMYSDAEHLYHTLHQPGEREKTMKNGGKRKLRMEKWSRYLLFLGEYLFLDFSRCRRLLDVGCGKGVVLKEAARFPFERIAGIELQKKLAETAERNFRILGLADRISCLQADAEEFDGYGDYDVFFFFNPFSEEIFTKVIDRILKSAKDDGPVTFIYHNPQYLDTLEERVKRFVRDPACVRKTVFHDKRKNYDTCILSI